MGVAWRKTILRNGQKFHQSASSSNYSPSDIGYQQTIDAHDAIIRRARDQTGRTRPRRRSPGRGRTLQRRLILPPTSKGSGSLRSWSIDGDAALIMRPVEFGAAAGPERSLIKKRDCVRPSELTGLNRLSSVKRREPP